MRHLGLQPSEIMRLPCSERDRYHRWIIQEVQEENDRRRRYLEKVNKV